MKRKMIAILEMLFIATAGLAFLACTGDTNNVETTQRTDKQELEKIYGVNELMQSDSLPSGLVQLEGIVSGASPEEQRMALIDVSEFQACGVTTCASLYLPVQWNGPLPKIEEQVQIKGRIQDESGNLIFVAEALQKVSDQTSETQ